MHAVESPDGLIRDEGQRLYKHVKYWAKTFFTKPIDTKAADVYLRRFSDDFDFLSVPPTTTVSIGKHLRSLSDSKPGPNGIPYYAYASGGPIACSILARVSRRAQSGLSFPYGFNDCEVLFPPKGSRDGDVVEVVRSESETRPLKCKNSDNKIIAGERNRAIAKIVAKGASTLQNGFIRGMNFLNNVVAIDTFARYASLKSDPNDFPLIVLFDLLCAFPSVSWDCMGLGLILLNLLLLYI